MALHTWVFGSKINPAHSFMASMGNVPHLPRYMTSGIFGVFWWGRTESAGKSRQRIKGESPYIVMASDQL